MTKKMPKRELLEKKDTKAENAAEYERGQMQVFIDFGIFGEYGWGNTRVQR